MNIQNKQVENIVKSYAEIKILSEIGALLGWDQNTYMPTAAAAGRADQAELIQSLLTDRWNNRELLAQIASVNDEELTDTERAIMRQVRRAVKFYTNVPKEIILQNTAVTTRAFSLWQEARARNDFALFAPTLAEVFALQRTIAEHLGYAQSPYDALLDLYEPELTSRDCDALFDELRKGLVQIWQEVGSRFDHSAQLAKLCACPAQIQKQEELSHYVMQLMQYPPQRGRLDVSAHPFTTELGPQDIRITTRYDKYNILMSLMPTIHEAGHALYELGIDQQYARTPLSGGVSLGIHESQSRFWENIIGRSRAFATHIHPKIIELFPHLSSLTVGDLYAALNHVQAQPIRVEADELTYNFHIMIRYEIEKVVIEGALAAQDIPAIWNQKMKEYLGVDVTSDALGCLQDVHWSYGSVGYFPTYTIGTVISAQLAAAMRKTIDIDVHVARGDLAPIGNWLQDNLHKWGSFYTPKELVQRITGSGIDVAEYLQYLRTKYLL